jgi:hypothetical protein
MSKKSNPMCWYPTTILVADQYCPCGFNRQVGVS